MSMTSQELARRIRTDCLKMTSRGGSSHIGSCLSVVDILAVLYSTSLRHKPSEPEWTGRDRCILSKGHAGAAMYAALAESGYFPTEQLETHYQNGSKLSGHVSHKDVPGVEFSTGSLGQGLSVASGMAYALKLRSSSSRVFAILSDGECDEGSVWEAMLFSSHHRLDNLVVFVDYNKIQSLSPVSETLGLEPFAQKWQSFGWAVREVNGHNHDEIRTALDALPIAPARPSCILAHTTKGKGVSFMENSVLWHYRTAKGAEFEDALKELEG